MTKAVFPLCQRCRSRASWRLTVHAEHLGQSRDVVLCGTHARPLRERRRTSAWRVTRTWRIVA